MSRALAIANTLDHFDSGAFLQTLSRRVASVSYTHLTLPTIYSV